MDWDRIFSSALFYKFLAACVELAIGLSLAPIVRRIILKFRAKAVDPGVLTFGASFSSISIRILTVIIALAQIGVPMGTIVGALSAVSLGITLALKESMANVAGGLQILVTKPFRVGDYISVSNTNEGTVKEIELMFTTLQTSGMQEVVIPNSLLTSSTLINYTIYPTRRILISLFVGLDADYSCFKQKALDIMKGQQYVLNDPAPSTYISSFSPDGDGMIINCVCYANQENYWTAVYQLNEKFHAQRKESELPQPESLIKVNN